MKNENVMLEEVPMVVESSIQSSSTPEDVNQLLTSCMDKSRLGSMHDWNIILRHAEIYNTPLAQAMAAYGFTSDNIYMVKNDKEKALGFAHRAFPWLLHQAPRGCMFAQLYLGMFYVYGIATEIDREASRVWITKSADQGYPQAIFNLGVVHERGDGCDVDRTAAVDCYLRAAELGNAGAMYSVANAYQFGTGILAADREKAFQWHERAAGMGFAPSICSLASRAYRDGNPEQAASLYRQAAEQNYPPAMFSLGLYYTNGIGVTQDHAEAWRLFKMAAEMEHSAAQNSIGVAYEKGTTGCIPDESPNLVEAVKWYTIAAEQGNQYAQCNLAQCFEHGKGCQGNIFTAISWYRKAAEQDHPPAQINLAVCLIVHNATDGFQEDYIEAVEWLNKAAACANDTSKGEATFILGICCEEGYGLPKSSEEALKWFSIGAQLGHEKAKEGLKRVSDNVNK